MSIVINAKGTSVPFFTVGKSGTTIYQGSVDPSLAYTPKPGDVWFNTGANSINSFVGLTSTWSAPQLADLNFSGNTIVAAAASDLTLKTTSGSSVILDAGPGNPKLTTLVGQDLYISGHCLVRARQ